MDVSVEQSVVSATAASGARSISKRLMSSAAKCCASAAEPPLPHASTLPPPFSVSARSTPARAIGAASAGDASSLSCALSANCALMRADSASVMCGDSTPSLDVDLDLHAPRRARRRKPADARMQSLAAVETPSERGVVAPGEIAELARTPDHRDGIGVVRIVTLAHELEAIAYPELLRHLRRGIVAQAGERRAVHQQPHLRLSFLGMSRGTEEQRAPDQQPRAIRRTHRGST